MRKHYMTLYFRNNTEVTYYKKNGNIIVTFEQPVKDRFNSLDVLLDGTIVNNLGFNSADVGYFVRFAIKNASAIKYVANEEV